MKRIVWISVTVLVAASLFIAIQLFFTARNARSLATELHNKDNRLTEQIIAARARLAAATRESVPPPPAQARTNTATPHPTATAKPAPRRDLADLMEANPALRRLFQQSFRANLGLRFRPFYNVAQLSPEEIDKFEALMTEAEQDKLDLPASAKTQGLGANDPALKKMWQQNDEKLQNTQKEILGEAGYQELQRYNRQEPLLYFNTMLAFLASETSTPLTASQCEKLQKVLSDASPTYQNGGKADLSTIDIPLAMVQAKQVLSPNQYAALDADFSGVVLCKLMDQFYQQKAATAK